jgi:hypothetical protein
MTQTWALVVDAYRELNAKKLFWITLALSLIVVLAFAAFGMTPTGFSLLWFSFESETFNSEIIPKRLFYTSTFLSLGIGVWLTWIATILALVATAGIFPDFISGGSIDLALSKPIGRLRLFLTKYILGLLFAVLQVTVFITAAFFVLGWRADYWDPNLFLAIPIVTVFFSYLFAVCVLIGMVTRSTIASLLFTLLFWFVLFGLNVTDGLFVSFRESAVVSVERAEQRLENERLIRTNDIKRERLENGEIPPEQFGEALVLTDEELIELRPGFADELQELEDAQASAANWQRWSGVIFGIKTVLPKTGETIGLLERSMISEDDIREQMSGAQPDPNAPDFADPEVQERVAMASRDRSVFWIVGTSLLFEGVVLGLAGLLFCRRDF